MLVVAGCSLKYIFFSSVCEFVQGNLVKVALA